MCVQQALISSGLLLVSFLVWFIGGGVLYHQPVEHQSYDVRSPFLFSNPNLRIKFRKSWNPMKTQKNLFAGSWLPVQIIASWWTIFQKRN
jgi:hypothetical protein